MRLNASLEFVTEAMGALPSARRLCDQVDVDRVRLPFERKAMELLIAHPAYLRAARKLEKHEDHDAERHGIPLPPKAAPGLFGIANEACRILGVHEEPKLLQTAHPMPNAATYFRPGKPAMIELNGPLATRLTPSEILAVLAHELGHHIMVRDLGFRRPLGRLIDALVDDDADGAPLLDALMALVILGHEFAADRYSILCGQELDAQLGAMMTITAGLPSEEVGLTATDYLEQCQAYVDDMVERGELHPIRTHPEHNLRVVAIWLFSESDLYRELTGQGSATFTIDEVNAGIEAVIDQEPLGYVWTHDDPPGDDEDPGLFGDIGSWFGRGRRR